MKQVITVLFFMMLSTFLLPGCHHADNNYRPAPATGAASIAVTNIEIRPNPYHLWPASNYKAGEYTVVVTVTNTGTAACTSSLFFTLKTIKADDHGNFNAPEKGIGGATLTDAILPHETKYVVIPIDGWLTNATAQGDFNSVTGTYKTRLSLNANDPVNINQSIPETLFQVINGG